MEFEQFISKIDTLKITELPGIEAHKLLAPLTRPVFNKYIIPKNARLAGVLILFYPDDSNQTQILLTKRARYNGKHSNQISFPGGKKEPLDSSLKITALRESLEEVGIDNISILKQLTTIYIPPSNFSVSPYIGYLNKTPAFTPNYEVEEIIELPVSKLIDSKTLTTFQNKNNTKIPCFNFKGHIIWGATAMILSEVKELLKTTY